MVSSRPTGMGVAGDGLLECFPENRDKFSEGVYRFINDRIKIGPLRIILRQVAADFFALKHRRKVLVFTSHQGPLLRHPRCLVIVYDFIVLHHPFQSRVQVMGFLFLLPRILRNSTTAVVISNNVREDVLRHLPWMSEKGVHAIPCVSTRLDSFSKGGEQWPARLMEGRFLFVGANYLHKRLEAAIEAILDLKRKGWKVGLDIVGISQHIWEKAFGFDFETLKSHGIVTRSYASNTELETLYSKAVGLLFLSECEGLGLPPLEAMRKNCPAVCNDIAVLRENCGDAAFYVDITQKGAVAELLEQMLSGKLESEINQKIILGNEQSMLFDRGNIKLDG